MELTGEKVITAPQPRVYDALHDPVILRQAVPGVETLTQGADGRYHITASLKLGPLRPTFTGSIEVYNEDRPSGYSLRGEAFGGPAGAVSGNAHVALAAVDAETTNLAFHITADTTGLGSLEGARIDVAARTLVAEFFSRLQSILDDEAIDAPSPVEVETSGAAPPQSAGGTMPDAPPPAGRHAPSDRSGADDPARDMPGKSRARRAEAAITDATGGPVGSAAAPPSAATLAGRRPAGSLPHTPYRPPDRTGYEAAESIVPAGRGAGVGRWIAAAAGIVAIALLLNDGFSGI